MGKNMKHALDFATRFPGWHSFSGDRATRESIARLASRGLVSVNQFQQFRKV